MSGINGQPLAVAAGYTDVDWDDGQVSVGGVAETTKKYFRFAKSAAYPYASLAVQISLKSNNVLYTSFCKFYDELANLLLTLSTNAIVETVLEGTCNVAAMGNGLHTIYVKIYSSNALGTATLQYVLVRGAV
jgi:hypothetical protein